MSENNADTLTSEFWENIERKKLVRPVCNLCGNNFFSPQVVCPDCQSSDWIYEESNGNGKIYRYTGIHRPMGDGFPNPYIGVDGDFFSKIVVPAIQTVKVVGPDGKAKSTQPSLSLGI